MDGDVQLIAKTVSILSRISDEPRCSLADVARAERLPFSTVHRIAQSLLQNGLLVRKERGRYLIGPALIGMAQGASLDVLLAEVGRRTVEKLAARSGLSAHLGVFENGMVTYIVKAAPRRASLFTAEGTQLEAYCSGLGKVLLAFATPDARDTYLAEGELVALTPATITDVDALRRELRDVRLRGWGADREEIAPGLRCLAVPVYRARGAACAALSVSGDPATIVSGESELLDWLRQASSEISRRVFGAAAGGGGTGPNSGHPASAPCAASGSASLEVSASEVRDSLRRIA